MALSVVVVVLVVVEEVAALLSSITTSFWNSNRGVRERERDNGGSKLLITNIFLYYSEKIWASS